MVVKTLAQKMARIRRYLARDTERLQSRRRGNAMRIASPAISATQHQFTVSQRVFTMSTDRQTEHSLQISSIPTSAPRRHCGLSRAVHCGAVCTQCGIFCASKAIGKARKSQTEYLATWCSLNWTGMIRRSAMSMLRRAALFPSDPDRYPSIAQASCASRTNAGCEQDGDQFATEWKMSK